MMVIIHMHAHFTHTLYACRIGNDILVTNTVDVNMSENAAYHTNTLLHRNPAYEDNCALEIDDPQLTEVEMSTLEPEYETIPLATDGTSGVVNDEDDYHRLNRARLHVNRQDHITTRMH